MPVASGTLHVAPDILCRREKLVRPVREDIVVAPPEAVGFGIYLCHLHRHGVAGQEIRRIDVVAAQLPPAIDGQHGRAFQHIVVKIPQIGSQELFLLSAHAAEQLVIVFRLFWVVEYGIDYVVCFLSFRPFQVEAFHGRGGRNGRGSCGTVVAVLHAEVIAFALLAPHRGGGINVGRKVPFVIFPREEHRRVAVAHAHCGPFHEVIGQAVFRLLVRRKRHRLRHHYNGKSLPFNPALHHQF